VEQNGAERMNGDEGREEREETVNDELMR